MGEIRPKTCCRCCGGQDLADELFGIMPVLIYPCRVFDYGAAGNGQMRSPRPDQMVRDDSGMFFDLGVYGVPLCVAAPAAPAPRRCPHTASIGAPPACGLTGRCGRSACKEKRRYDPVTPMRAMESFIRQVGGYSFLYADTFLTKEELREMFDHTAYDRCAAAALSAHKPPPGPLPITGERLRVAVRGCRVRKAYRADGACTAGRPGALEQVSLTQRLGCAQAPSPSCTTRSSRRWTWSLSGSRWRMSSCEASGAGPKVDGIN